MVNAFEIRWHKQNIVENKTKTMMLMDTVVMLMRNLLCYYYSTNYSTYSSPSPSTLYLDSQPLPFVEKCSILPLTVFSSLSHLPLH